MELSQGQKVHYNYLYPLSYYGLWAGLWAGLGCTMLRIDWGGFGCISFILSFLSLFLLHLLSSSSSCNSLYLRGCVCVCMGCPVELIKNSRSFPKRTSCGQSLGTTRTSCLNLYSFPISIQALALGISLQQP